MTSVAQIAANRANARLSTGPRTETGKDQSRYNALRHGLYARDVVLPGEDRDEYHAMRAELMDEFAPKGRYETTLVRRLADIWWRLGRTASVEAGLLNPDWDGLASAGPESDGGTLIGSFRLALDETETLDTLGRYEARLERAFHHVVVLLERRQARRRMRDGEAGE
ncbi:MAG: hypothetical protein HOH04_10180 [Rhodospirillaceae bacterium]|jgi:hypothetical protein|nr:hypothetical protein [Rhodospirillaceae bacterium]